MECINAQPRLPSGQKTPFEKIHSKEIYSHLLNTQPRLLSDRKHHSEEMHIFFLLCEMYKYTATSAFRQKMTFLIHASF